MSVTSDYWIQTATPIEISSQLQEGLNWVNSNPSVADANTVLMYAWNEFDEGGWISPTLYYGTDRLDAIQNVLLPLITDTTAPAAITNLAVSSTASSSAVLTWTAPGNNGSIGTATSYDIRYSTSAINNANWASATQSTGERAPAIAGTSQSFTVTGLSASTTYYFAIKTSDEVPNVSSLSNVPSGTTTSSSSNLALNKTYNASSVWDASQSADKAFDGLTSTNWQSVNGGGFAGQWLEVNFGVGTTFNKVVLSEYGSRTTGFRIEVWNGTVWATAYTGTAIGGIEQTREALLHFRKKTVEAGFAFERHGMGDTTRQYERIWYAAGYGKWNALLGSDSGCFYLNLKI